MALWHEAGLLQLFINLPTSMALWPSAMLGRSVQFTSYLTEARDEVLRGRRLMVEDKAARQTVISAVLVVHFPPWHLLTKPAPPPPPFPLLSGRGRRRNVGYEHQRRLLL